MATAEALLTAEEFGRRPDPGYPEELVQGRIVTMPPQAKTRSGLRDGRFRILDRYVDEHDLGQSSQQRLRRHHRARPCTVRGARHLVLLLPASVEAPPSRPDTLPSHPISSSRFARPMIAGGDSCEGQ